jgi:hypothetical protein
MRTPRSTPSVLAGLMTIALAAAAPLRAQSYPPLHVDPSVEDCSVRFAPTLTQGAFRRFAREFGSVSAFKQAASPATLGRGRVLIGVEWMSFTVDDNADAWNDTFYHPDDHHPLGERQSFPKVKLRAGVTDRMDLGAFYTLNPQANYGWIGVDAKYGILAENDDRELGLAVRGAYTGTLYVSDMDMHAITADVSVSRRLGHDLRPYVGLGADGVFVRETSDAVDLRSERTVAPHVFGGFDATVWGRLSLGAELALGARPSAQLQLGALLF